MNGWIGIVGVLALCGLTACAEGEEEPKVADDSDVTELIEETDSTSDNEGGDASETDEPADTDPSNSDDTVDNPADVDGDGSDGKLKIETYYFTTEFNDTMQQKTQQVGKGVKQRIGQ